MKDVHVQSKSLLRSVTRKLVESLEILNRIDEEVVEASHQAGKWTGICGDIEGIL